MSRSIQCLSFYDWLLSRSIMSSRFIRVVAGVKTSLLSKEEENFILRAPHFVCPFTPSIGGRSGHFYLGRRLLGTTPQRTLVCADPSRPLHSRRWAPAQQWDRGSRGSSLFQFWGTAVPHSMQLRHFTFPGVPLPPHLCRHSLVAGVLVTATPVGVTRCLVGVTPRCSAWSLAHSGGLCRDQEANEGRPGCCV